MIHKLNAKNYGMNDDILKDNIETKLLFDIWIEDEGTIVEIDNGIVILSGGVDSDSQRVRAYEYICSLFEVEATNAEFSVPVSSRLQEVQNDLVIE